MDIVNYNFYATDAAADANRILHPSIVKVKIVEKNLEILPHYWLFILQLVILSNSTILILLFNKCNVKNLGK